MKNCNKNDENVVKQLAVSQFEEFIGLNIKHGKMSEMRKDELIVKIMKVVSNDLEAFTGVETDIKVTQNEANGDISVDLIAHLIRSNEEEPDKMVISYAASVSTIKNASLQAQEKACQLMQRLV